MIYPGRGNRLEIQPYAGFQRRNRTGDILIGELLRDGPHIRRERIIYAVAVDPFQSPTYTLFSIVL